MDKDTNKNLILALVLSLGVLIAWELFYGLPKMQEQQRQQEQAQQQTQTETAAPTAPATLAFWDRVSCISPVPGGISMTR